MKKNFTKKSNPKGPPLGHNTENQWRARKIDFFLITLHLNNMSDQTKKSILKAPPRLTVYSIIKIALKMATNLL